MRPIPLSMRKKIAEDPFMKHCIYPNCIGYPEWEHAWIYRGKQINEPWAIVPVCMFHHRGIGLDKDFNRYHSIVRASEEDFKKYPRTDWQQLKKYLLQKFSQK